MVLAWVRDVTQYQNPLADEQIIYFYQWLRSPRSLFYDPALRRTVQKLMKKVSFSILVITISGNSLVDSILL